MRAEVEPPAGGQRAATPGFTAEQQAAIELREGELLLDAGAGSGKTTVLVERFARAVLEDGVAPAAILTITFTEKAAAELRERIRTRLRGGGAGDAARATETAPISTIHGFCARLLRAHALAAGLDPAFAVLDRPRAEALAEQALDGAIETLAAEPPGRELIAALGGGALRETVRSLHGQLRAAGQQRPRLPELPAPSDLAAARARLEQAARAVAAELGALEAPGVRVSRALEALESCTAVVQAAGEPWPGELDALALGNGGGALASELCEAYREALRAFRRACAERHAALPHRLLDGLLGDFAARYAAAKRDASGVDFEDLELLALALLRGDPTLRERLRARFRHVMVDEFQDTNRVQLELIELIAEGNLFTVGDAQQSIYGFRHADVELFLERGTALAAAGRRLTLQTNFRSRPEVLAVIERAFAAELGEVFMPLRAGREEAAAGEPRVELLVCEKSPDWDTDGVATPWRVAEARLLAARIGELLDGGAAPRDVVVLMRATTDMRVYERALEELSIPTYVIGGRGYWGHPQVADTVAYLRALANPLDEEALLGVLASPFAGVSLDALVVLCASARAAQRDPWSQLREPGEAFAVLDPREVERLQRFAAWFGEERRMAARLSVEELIERGVAGSGYDLRMLELPGGRRRLANVRKLMRLARDHEAAGGRDPAAFLELVRGRQGGWVPDPQESEAPVEGEALDTVRLMTIHRAKGLEFDITCVADLGRAPWRYPELVRIGRDGRIGLAVARLGAPGREPAFAYEELGEEQAAAEAREERRLYYVAATRARERLILSGAARWEPWRRSGSAMGWLAPALLGAGEEEGERLSELIEARAGVREGVRFRFVSVAEEEAPPRAPAAPSVAERAEPPANAEPPAGPEPPLTAFEAPAPSVSRLSYSALGEYRRCGYRFYVERVLGLPPREVAPGGSPPADAAGSSLSAPERGVLLHRLLETLDFRRPLSPSAERIQALAPRALAEGEAAQLAILVARFGESELCRRLAEAFEVRREERFAYALDGLLVTGAFDVLARERDGTLLVVDYKSDRIREGDPGRVVVERYSVQQLVYGLAALRTGAREGEVAHVFLELPEEPVRIRHDAADLPELEGELAELTAGCRAGRYEVTAEPRREICIGCPAEGGLCSWPLEMTRRQAADRLF